MWPGTTTSGMEPKVKIAKHALATPEITPLANPARTNEQLKLFWIGVGKEDGLFPVISDYLTVLDEKKIKHETLISEGGHTWMNCKTYLTTVAQKLFR